MLSAIAALVVGLLGVGLKVWLATRKSAAQQLDVTTHAELEDAANRPRTVDNAIDRM